MALNTLNEVDYAGLDQCIAFTRKLKFKRLEQLQAILQDPTSTHEEINQALTIYIEDYWLLEYYESI